jgi:carbohydrate binding protein with CBM4/9 domain
MQRTPPRHLAPPQRARSRARDHLLVESILALMAIGLTTAILIGSLVERPESSAARLPNLLPPAPTTTRAAATTPSPSSSRPAPGQSGNLLADPGFETGLDGWSAVGKAGLEQVEESRSGGWSLRMTRGSSRWPGALHTEVASLKADKRYEASVWVKASKPGIEVQVNLFELRGGKRFAVDTVGAIVQAGEWQRLDVSHDTHRPGTTLALELLAPNLASGTNLLVDDLAVRATSSSMSVP